MDLSVIIISVIIVAVFVVPIYIVSLQSSSEQKRKLKIVKSMAVSHQLQFSEVDVWKKYAIGIDTQSKTILYANGYENNLFSQIIELKNVKKCEVRKSFKTVENESIVDKIDLQLFYSDASKSQMLLEIYHAQGKHHIDNEFQLAEKWVKIINENLKTA